MSRVIFLLPAGGSCCGGSLPRPTGRGGCWRDTITLLQDTRPDAAGRAMNAARATARVPAAGAGCGSWEITGRETTGYRHRKVRRGLPASRARHFTATGLPVFHRTTPAHRNPGFSPVSDPRFGIRSPIPSLAMCRRVVMLDGRAPRKRRSLFRCRKPPRTQIFGRTCPGGTAPRPPITTARDQPLIGRGYGGL